MDSAAKSRALLAAAAAIRARRRRDRSRQCRGYGRRPKRTGLTGALLDRLKLDAGRDRSDWRPASRPWRGSTIRSAR
jgi:hypothetical protein